MSSHPGVTGPSVVHVLPDRLGGVFNFCANLLGHRGPGLPHGAVLTDNVWSIDVRAQEPLPADWQTTVPEALPRENLYAALRRVHRAVRGEGALVAHDWIELASVAAFPPERTVFSIVHGDFPYYYDLAVRHESDVDVFVTYTEQIRRRLVELMPARSGDIIRIRYGVEIRGRRRPAPGPLRLIYVGRLDRAKGVFDLPQIDDHLRRAGCQVMWTVQGSGPHENALKEAWRRPDIRWTGRRSMEAVLAEYEQQDVLVMPVRSEGLPVALLEAGAAGVVPVISDLASGIPEVVEQGRSGYRVAVGDTQGFADAIVRLAADRPHLDACGAAMHAVVARDWDITRQAREYQALFERWREFRRTHLPRRPPYGSRLDQRWLPNTVVRTIRRLAAKRSTKTPPCVESPAS